MSDTPGSPMASPLKRKRSEDIEGNEDTKDEAPTTGDEPTADKAEESAPSDGAKEGSESVKATAESGAGGGDDEAPASVASASVGDSKGIDEKEEPTDATETTPADSPAEAAATDDGSDTPAEAKGNLETLAEAAEATENGTASQTKTDPVTPPAPVPTTKKAPPPKKSAPKGRPKKATASADKKKKNTEEGVTQSASKKQKTVPAKDEKTTTDTGKDVADQKATESSEAPKEATKGRRGQKKPKLSEADRLREGVTKVLTQAKNRSYNSYALLLQKLANSDTDTLYSSQFRAWIAMGSLLVRDAFGPPAFASRDVTEVFPVQVGDRKLLDTVLTRIELEEAKRKAAVASSSADASASPTDTTNDVSSAK